MGESSGTDESMQVSAPGESLDAKDVMPDNTNVKLNDGTVEFNRNDKIGGVLDNKSTEQMLATLQTIADLLAISPRVAIGDEQLIEIQNKIAARRTFTK